MNISKRSHHPIVSLLLIGLIVASSCAPTPTTVQAPLTPLVTVIVPTALQTPTRLPTATLVPTETVTPFLPKATIKIASQSPLSGEYALAGTGVMHGAELGVKQLTVPLMGLGYEVELIPYDDQNDLGLAVTIAKKIVADPDTLCVVGPYTSRIMNQVKEIYHQAGLAFVSPSATAAFATGSSYLEVNRIVGRHDAQGAVGAQFANAKGFERVFVISEGGNYAEFNAYHFRNEVSRLGLDVVGNITVGAAEKFGRLIDRVLATNADLVYFSTLNLEQAGTFFREARAGGYLGAFLGNEGINNPALLEFAGPLLIDGGGMYYTAIGAPARSYPGTAHFLEDFETRYGETPQIFAAQAYDAAGVCMKAVEEASTAKAGEIPTRAEVSMAVRGLRDYQGITGVYNFNQNGDPNPAQYFVFQVVSTDPGDWNQNSLIDSFEVVPPE